MKKILPLILIMPCIALGASSHPNALSKASTTTGSTRIVSVTRSASANHNQAAFSVTGFVRDASGQPLVGVSVSIKGTSTGTQTDVNGKFAITANLNDVIVFSYIGYIKKEVTVITPASLTIELDEDSKELSEVVVTALGIKKERKSLGYSVTEVKGSDLTQARQTNFASELEGKVAGLDVTTISGGAASSVNINIRGAASLPGRGNNQPLYVINGVKMTNADNSQNVGLAMNSGGTYDNAPDQGDGIGNINPDDIESISVLKGAAAAALYGHDAKYGVILITTKSGSGKGSVEYSTNYEFEKAINPTDYQYQYGNGSEGLKPTSAASAFSSGQDSWGAKLDGSSVVQFDGVSRPYSAQTNNFDEFYRTGGAFTNTVAFSKSYDLAAIRLSASDLHDNSIVPSAGYDRKSFNFSGNFSPVKRLMIDAHLNYTDDFAHNRPILGDGAGNSSYQVLFLPTSLSVNTLDRAASGTITQKDLNNGYTGLSTTAATVGSEFLFANNGYASNPWFAADKFVNNSGRNRYIASASARYTFDDGLFAQVRVGQDYYNERFTDIVPNGAGYYSQANQNLAETYATVSELNTDFLIGKAFKVTPDFTITPNIGGNIEKSKTESTTEAGVGFVVPYVYTVNNLATKSIAYADYNEQINSVYGTLELAYKSYLYISGSAREDWFSELASSADPNNKLSIIYPAVDGSFVFSELFKPSWMDFGKVRVGWANVGGTTRPYQTLLNYNLLSTQSNGMPIGIISNTSTPNASLKPSNAEELEIGTEIHTLKNRLNFDITWYDKTSKNEIVPAPASITSGYQGAVVNIGKIRNKGWEFLVSGTPVKEKNFTWNSSINGSYNANTILALAEGQSSLPVAFSRTTLASTVDVVGKAADQVQAFDYARNADGSIKLDANGVPMQGALKQYGSAYGPWGAGFSNDFTFNHVTFSFLIDGKFGGHVFAGDEYYAEQYGLTKSTLPGRETGFPNGTSTPTTAEDYYVNLGQRVSGMFVQNASFIKLRQITLGYNLPTGIFGKVIQSANLSFVARNLFYLMKRTTDIDPEASYGTVSQGLELGGVPTTRTYGLNLDVKF